MQYRSRIHLLAAIFLFMGAGGISVSALAESENGIVIENDGVTINVTTPDINNVVALKMRVVGPDGFEFEDRLEASATEWIPDPAFADGDYRYEVIAVSVIPGSEMRAANTAETGQLPSPQSTIQSHEGKHTLSGSAVLPAREIPVERLYKAEDKRVHRASGSFRVINNVMEPIEDTKTDESLTQHNKSGTLGRIASAISRFFISEASAQLGEFEDLDLEKNSSSGPRLVFTQLDTDNTTSLHDWVIRGNEDRWRLWDSQTSSEPIFVESGAKQWSLYVRGTTTGELSNPLVGIGNSTPTATLHATSNTPRIRLEDLNDASDWYVKASNSGRFEIAETPGSTNPFSIQSGAPDGALHVAANGFVGIGTGAPERELHVLGSHVRIEQTSSTWDLNPGSSGLWFNRPTPGALFGVLKLQNDAPADSIVASAAGVGIGTANPETRVDVVSDQVVPFRLRNTGQANLRFSLVNGQAGTTWTFDNNGNQFRISKVGGSSSGAAFRLLENGDGLFAGDVFANGVQLTSARSKKTDFKAIDHDQVLDKVARLEVAEWRYKTDAETDRHIGPFAEDFQSLFGIGDGKHISAVDFAGVSLSAIKALKNELSNKNARIEELSARLSALEERMGPSSD